MASNDLPFFLPITPTRSFDRSLQAAWTPQRPTASASWTSLPATRRRRRGTQETVCSAYRGPGLTPASVVLGNPRTFPPEIMCSCDELRSVFEPRFLVLAELAFWGNFTFADFLLIVPINWARCQSAHHHSGNTAQDFRARTPDVGTALLSHVAFPAIPATRAGHKTCSGCLHIQSRRRTPSISPHNLLFIGYLRSAFHIIPIVFRCQ